MHVIKKYIFFTFVFFFTNLSARVGEIDSLINELKIIPADTSKVNSLNVLSDKIWQRGDYEEAMTYAQQGKTLAEKLMFKKGEATARTNISLIYWKQGLYPKALEQAFEGLKINEAIENKKGIARSRNLIGLIYFNQKNYDQAKEQYERSLKIIEKIIDKQGIAGSLSNIAEVYKQKGINDSALAMFTKALKINEELGNKNWASININNIGGIYFDLGNGTADSEMKSKYYEKALQQYLNALKIREEIGDKQGIAQSFISLGSVNANLKKNNEAREYLNDALSLSKNIGYKEAIQKAYFVLSIIDSTESKWQDAYDHHRLHIIYRDSLLNEENIRKSVRAEMNFEQEKKDAAVKEEKQKQMIIIVSVSAGLIFVLILALVILRSLRQNQKQNKIITAQKELVEEQKRIVDEKQKEITDSINYAERIQRSFLATEQLLDENLKEYFVFFQPKDIVSGDFYWASKLDNGQFALVTADSTGHGVPGAIMSILNISCLEKAIEDKRLTAPNEILNYTRTKIIERLKKDGSAEGGKDGMDCSILCFDVKNKSLNYSAANNPVWIVKNITDAGVNKFIEYTPDKMPVGKHDKDALSFTQHSINFEKGDMIYTITDGMPDQFGGPKGKKFMYKQLKELLSSIANLPMAEQKEKLKNSFTSWKGSLDQVDDVCIIGVRL